MTEGQNLFVTEVGSRMWGMATPESDYDHVVVYQVPTPSRLPSSSAKSGGSEGQTLRSTTSPTIFSPIRTTAPSIGKLYLSSF